MHNFSNAEDYWERLKYFFNVLSADLYGTSLGYILITLFIVLCVVSGLSSSNEHFRKKCFTTRYNNRNKVSGFNCSVHLVLFADF